MKKLTLMLMCLIAGTWLAFAQTTVTGTVTSATDGEPILGASVIVKGTTIGTVTDLDGKFSLEVPASGKSLVFSFIGMDSKEEQVKPNMRITLSDASFDINEVVVTAMGVSRDKKALGYASQDLKSETLTQAATSNLASSLQGKVSGVEIKSSSGMPGASQQITIRGARSFTGDNTPLYVVDGMPISSTSDLSTGNSVTGADYSARNIDIDPNDIESINILKGQAASALYGIRASNGVIIITTKSGKGLKEGKAEISFTTNISADVIAYAPENQTTYAQGSNGLFNPTATTSWGPKIVNLPKDPGYGGETDNTYTKKDGKKPGMYYVPQRANAGLDPWVSPKTYKNIKDFFNTGTTWNNSLNVAQAKGESSYSFSLGNSQQKGIIPTTGMDRYNVKLTAETKLHEQWKTGFTGNYVNTTINKSTGANDGLVATIYPAPASYDLKGIPSHYDGDLYRQNTYRSTGGFDAAYWSIKNNRFTESTNRFFGNAFVDFFTKMGTDNMKLNLNYQLGTDSYTTHFQDVWGYGHSNGSGWIENSGMTVTTFNSLLKAIYDWKINDEWNLNAILGNEMVDDQNKYYYQYGANYNFPGWNHINNTTVKDNSETQSSQRTVGFFGSVNASYKNMLYLTMTGRNDVVSTMPRGNRSFFYPSFSAGFIFTELESIKNEIVTFGKVRASYAEVGQAGKYIPSYYSTPTYGGGFYTGTPILYPMAGVTAYTPYIRVYDPNLKPQNTKSYELGVDLSFWNNLLSLNYTYSRQNVKDQIFPVPLAASTGSSELITNGGNIHTNAHEITLSANPIKTKLVDWNVGLNWTKIDNYVDDLAEGVDNIFLGGFVTPQVRANKGDKFPVIYGNQYARDTKGHILVDEAGLPYSGAPGVIGKVSPDFILGFNTTVRIQKFVLSAVMDWKQGGQMYSGTARLLDYYGTSIQSGNREGTTVFPGYKEDGKPNNIKIEGPNAHQKYYSALNNIDEACVYGTSFIKLREVALSYKAYKTAAIELNVNVFARNFMLWSELKNVNPESSQGNTNMIGAFERFSLPQTQSFGAGLNVKF